MTVYKKHQLYVMTKAKDLAKYIITITEKSPKKFRYTLVARLQNHILDIIENLHLANSYERGSKERLELQESAKRKLVLLDYIAQLAMEQECILFKQYEQISKQQAETLMYLNKWATSDKKIAGNQNENIEKHSLIEQSDLEEIETDKIDWEKVDNLVDIV